MPFRSTNDPERVAAGIEQGARLAEQRGPVGDRIGVASGFGKSFPSADLQRATAANAPGSVYPERGATLAANQGAVNKLPGAGPPPLRFAGEDVGKQAMELATLLSKFSFGPQAKQSADSSSGRA